MANAGQKCTAGAALWITWTRATLQCPASVKFLIATAVLLKVDRTVTFSACDAKTQNFLLPVSVLTPLHAPRVKCRRARDPLGVHARTHSSASRAVKTHSRAPRASARCPASALPVPMTRLVTSAPDARQALFSTMVNVSTRAQVS